MMVQRSRQEVLTSRDAQSADVAMARGTTGPRWEALGVVGRRWPPLRVRRDGRLLPLPVHGDHRRAEEEGKQASLAAGSPGGAALGAPPCRRAAPWRCSPGGAPPCRRGSLAARSPAGVMVRERGRRGEGA
jgi:hypothetical protein